MADITSFRAARDELLGGSSRGGEFCVAYTSLVDSFLSSLLPCDVEGVALVAVGGYGRRELCPGSDVDVWLVHGRRAGKEANSLAESVWYPLWDTGLQVGHAVRTPKEALALAASDIDTATALLDIRAVAGDADLVDDLAARAAGQWEARSSRGLEALGRSVAERHERAGEVAFLLEPDLKEGRGGLRDVHALRWAEAARRILLPADDDALAAAHEVLLAARVELQRSTGKAADRLLLQEQDAVARALGDADADVLMARVSAAARTVAWTSDDAWDRISASLGGPSGRVASADHPIDDGILLREGRVELTPDADPAGDPTLVLRAAAAAAGRATRLGRAALDRLAVAPGPGDPWPDEARHALVRLLASGRAAIPVLESLDQARLLVRTLPEWKAVRHRPQRNAYHRFTVDRHLCEAAAEAASLTHRVDRPDLLLVGSWLHDIGKGHPDGAVPGGHSESGADIVHTLATRMGFAPADVATLVSLVRHHLLLAEIATRRDPDDPATAATVVGAVGDVETLRLLHALTEADGSATGAAAWGPWKASLVADLVARVEAALAGAEPATTTFPGAEHLVLAARCARTGEVAVKAGGSSLDVAAADRPRLFSLVAGTLTVNGLDVLRAKAWSGDDGVAVQHFEVVPVVGDGADWVRVEADLRLALGGRLSLEGRLAERARDYAGRPRLAAAAPARTQVRLTNDASETATVVEVRAPDRIGTLYRATRALADLDLDIRYAKVSSLGHEVVDVFYVLGPGGQRVADPDRVADVVRAVETELSRV